MQGLPFVDNIDLARLLAFIKKPGKHVARVEPAKPDHFKITRVPGAMGTRQHRRVTEGPQTMVASVAIEGVFAAEGIGRFFELSS